MTLPRQPEDKRICANCVVEPYLRAQIASSREVEACDYCGESAPTVSLDYVAGRVNEVMSRYFTLTSETTAVVVYGRSPAGDTLIEIVSGWLAQDDIRPAEDLQDVMLGGWRNDEYGWYGDDPWFVRGTGGAWDLHLAWNTMEKSLQQEARLVNPLVVETLEKVFGGVHADRTERGESVIRELGPGSLQQTLFRARVFQTQEALNHALEHPERELGAPAPAVAAAGRMNARGVSVFYGAIEPDTALREVRPPVGSQVVVAAFNVIRPLRLLDLTALRAARADPSLSLFDPATAAFVERSDFLNTLEERLTAPVMPAHTDDGYLITQAVADFLSTHPRLNLDGIYFPSVQSLRGADDAHGHNVILFHKAALVMHSRPGEELETRAGLAYSGEDDEPPGPGITTLVQPEDSSPLPSLYAVETIKPSLELNRDSLVIHTVRGVEVVTVPVAVEHRVAPARHDPSTRSAPGGFGQR